MTVTIGEVEHVPVAPASASGGQRGGGGGSGGGQSEMSAPDEAAMIAVLRREMSRMARLWAD